LTNSVLPYHSPTPPRRGPSWLGISSVAAFVLFWVLSTQLGKDSPRTAVVFVLAVLSDVAGFALGLASLIVHRGNTWWGWGGLILNSIPLIGLALLPLVIPG
jgi:hypothetical protein